MPKNIRNILNQIYEKLYSAFGPQHWWPGDTQIEIMVGAILTQNTNWGNVEKAINNLKAAKKLSVKALLEISQEELAILIKPAGYYNIKAKRLKNFINFLRQEYRGNLKEMEKETLPKLREKLLSVNGVGPETADSILLYAFNKPVFVIDAYTKRVCTRHKLAPEDVDYLHLQKLFMDNLPHNAKMFNEYHALIVRLAKEYCKTTPHCANCILKKDFDKNKSIGKNYA